MAKDRSNEPNTINVQQFAFVMHIRSFWSFIIVATAISVVTLAADTFLTKRLIVETVIEPWLYKQINMNGTKWSASVPWHTYPVSCSEFRISPLNLVYVTRIANNL